MNERLPKTLKAENEPDMQDPIRAPHPIGFAPTDIRRIHRICEQHEATSNITSTAPPHLAEFFNITYALLGLSFVLVLTSFVLVVGGDRPLSLFISWSLLIIICAYTATSILFEIWHLIRDIIHSANPFSAADATSTEEEIKRMIELSRVDEGTVDYAASWLENRAASFRNHLEWLKGSSVLAAATFGALFWEKSPLKEMFQELYGHAWMAYIQLGLLFALIGIILGICAIWQCSARSSDRALFLRRSLRERPKLARSELI